MSTWNPAPSPGAALGIQDLPSAWREISPTRGLRDLALVWAGIAAVAAACGAQGGVFVHALGFVLIGALQNHLSSLLHHAIHANLHPSRGVNLWLARLALAAPMAQIFSVLRWEHLHHHAHLGAADDPERFYYDLDRHGRRQPGRFRRWVAGLFAGWLVIPILRRALRGSRDETAAPAPPRDRARRREARLDLLLIPPAQLLLFVLFFALHGSPFAWLGLWALPAATLGGGLTALRATLDHADADLPPKLLLSYRSNPLELFFVAPFHFNYHYEHHRFMTVPYYHAPKLREMLLARGDFADALLLPSYLGRVQELARRLGTR